jgi:hypothetical protein
VDAANRGDVPPVRRKKWRDLERRLIRLIGFGISYADHRKLKLSMVLSGENKINSMFTRIPYYDAQKINSLAYKSFKNIYCDPNKIGNNLI